MSFSLRTDMQLCARNLLCQAAAVTLENEEIVSDQQ